MIDNVYVIAKKISDREYELDRVATSMWHREPLAFIDNEGVSHSFGYSSSSSISRGILTAPQKLGLQPGYLIVCSLTAHRMSTKDLRELLKEEIEQIVNSRNPFFVDTSIPVVIDSSEDTMILSRPLAPISTLQTIDREKFIIKTAHILMNNKTELVKVRTSFGPVWHLESPGVVPVGSVVLLKDPGCSLPEYYRNHLVDICKTLVKYGRDDVSTTLQLCYGMFNP